MGRVANAAKVGLPDETCNAYVAEESDTCDAEAMCMNCMVTVRVEEVATVGVGWKDEERRRSEEEVAELLV